MLKQIKDNKGFTIGEYPVNPFTKQPTAVVRDVAPGSPGEINISNLRNGGYRIRGQGARALLLIFLQQGE